MHLYYICIKLRITIIIIYIYINRNKSFITTETDNRSFTSNSLDTKTRASGFQKITPSKLIKIYRLTGYIFFAPSYDICDQIKNEVKKNNSNPNSIKIQHISFLYIILLLISLILL